MQLLILLASLAIAQLWEHRNPLQRDGWFYRWVGFLQRTLTRAEPPVRLASAVGLPVVALLLVMVLLAKLSYWLWLPLGIAVLLYSLGRESMTTAMAESADVHLCELEDASPRSELEPPASAPQGEWNSVHEEVLQKAAYRGFEHMFAVLFWFWVLGPPAALLYRLSWLYVQRDEQGEVAQRWLWMMEWPAVRVLGISFAVTGNFVGCVQHWRECFFCGTRSSGEVLVQAIAGALAVDGELQARPCISEREVAALQGLYRRTLWLWLGVIGVWAILG